MFLKSYNFRKTLQEQASYNHTTVAGLYDKLQRFKPNRIPFMVICDIMESEGINIDVCPYGDILYNVNWLHYGDTHKRVKQLLEAHGYWIGATGTIYKNLANGNYDAVGELR